MQISELHIRFSNSKGICTDTRKIEKDTIFFALKGDNFNGNEFAQKALDEGCSFAVIDEPEYGTNDQFIVVDSVLETLQKLANYHRKQFDIPVLGITGSNGKTTTKELIGVVLEKKFNLLITAGNFNNHLGVPFTLLKLTEDHDFAVIEMGANKPGDITELCEIAEPNFGMITNIGAAHIEGFGSLEGVIETKTGMYRWIKSVGGKLFCNAEDEILTSNLPNVDTYYYGEEKGNVTGTLVAMTPFVKFKWSKAAYASDEIETNLVGRYNFTNFLSAAAIGSYFGVDEDLISEALSAYTPSNNRSQVQRSDRNMLIVDCYNANATSMNAALESFFEVEHGNKLAILGDMLELGSISSEEHQKVADLLEENGINAFLVGTEFKKTKTELPVYDNYEQLLNDQDLSALIDTLVLLKGSRGIRLENLIEHL